MSDPLIDPDIREFLRQNTNSARKRKFKARPKREET